jgi:hypothetical protein
MKMSHQSVEEINRVFREWETNYAPKDLIIDSQKNIDLMVDYVRLHHGGIASITSLNDAAAKISNLERRPAKTQAQIAEEFEAKELARRIREANENRVDWKENAKKIIDAQDKKREHDDKQAVAKEAINTSIESYYANRRNGPGYDFGLTESRRAELRRLVAGQKPNVCQLSLLALVRKKIMEYPE